MTTGRITCGATSERRRPTLTPSRQYPSVDDHRPRKRFGQHFLHDQRVLTGIVEAIAPQPDDCVVEIGPGQGALTWRLLDRVRELTAVEIDRDLAARLVRDPRTEGRLGLIQADALTVDFADLRRDARPLRVVGNLPYNISTPLIFHLLSFKTDIQDMHFLLQKEVVERLAAGPGEPAYGRLSVMVQYACAVEKLFDVGPGAFTPPPKVDSAVVRLRTRSQPTVQANDFALLQRVVQQAFSQRRKMLGRSLRGLASPQQIVAAGIEPTLRPERLAITDFVKLCNILSATNEG